MTDGDLSILVSLISKCELELEEINLLVENFLRNKVEANEYEKEVLRIQNVIYSVKKILENKNSTHNKNFVLEKNMIEDCFESIVKLKNSIDEFDKKNIGNKVSSKLVDFEQNNAQEILKDISEVKSNINTKKQSIVENELDNEVKNQIKTIEEAESKNERNVNIKNTYSKTKLAEATNEYKNSMGFRVDIFPNLNTNILDLSFKNKLQIQDSIGKHIQYTPRMVWHNPRSDFPSTPLSKFSNPEFFDQLGLDTLLFIFYFQQGTFQQFLAIQELKRKKWRFHKKCFAWFYKRSDAKITTEDAEVADYVYFDFEKDWCQKVKNDFTFEFAHLDNTPIVINKFNGESSSCFNNDSNLNNELINNSSLSRDSK